MRSDCLRPFYSLQLPLSAFSIMTQQTFSKNFLVFFVIIVALLALLVFSFVPKRSYSPGAVTGAIPAEDKKSAILSLAHSGRPLGEDERREVSEYLGENPAPLWNGFTLEEKTAIISALNKN